METYIFPFWKVDKGSKVIIYGAGRVGQIFWQELITTGYCEVVAIADREWEKYELLSENIKVIDPETIAAYSYDYIVIAINNELVCQKVVAYLKAELGVSGKKIIYDSILLAPNKIVPMISRKMGYYSDKFAYEIDNNGVRIAVFVGNGLGDIIIAKKYIMEILRLSPPHTLLDMFGKAEFIEAVCSDLPQLHNVFPWNFYASQCQKYDLAVYVTYLLSLDKISENKIELVAPRLLYMVRNLSKQLNLYGLAGSQERTLNSVHFARCRYFNRNAYTAYTEAGGLEIKDTRVPIPMSESECTNFNNLGLMYRNYITFHYGWGEISSKNKKHAKVWLSTYFTKLAEMIHGEYPELCIVQIGGDNELHLDGIDKEIIGKNLELVKYILKNALLHVDCEGGLVHLATQLGTKCAVLFGPTPQWYFGYEENINISANICPPCCYLEDNFASCIRRLDEPECMKALHPDMVMEKIRKYLDTKIHS
ncbi:hypothetical protein SELR_23570 [Selenomonas ruminantium subsp. lactilytica TAM6421]|uniref:ADP-heptose:LPS heptosyltransferase n=1 Tax=Selenomonas ruminantium subsp. lactilytica (strain NBRC 103574 / TAM6421) TaxID=927704 RepID=I0GTH8_SELRL|nr:hypothetical protein [Selenomonas ruminantium]BAL84065.1 hypothetical protein SELR_23570 [Selenomonas ruminantium subsp. lactilytica TAM6421]